MSQSRHSNFGVGGRKSLGNSNGNDYTLNIYEVEPEQIREFMFRYEVTRNFERMYRTKMRFAVYGKSANSHRFARQQAMEAAKKIAEEFGIQARVFDDEYESESGWVDEEGNSGSYGYETETSVYVTTDEVELAIFKKELQHLEEYPAILFGRFEEQKIAELKAKIERLTSSPT